MKCSDPQQPDIFDYMSSIALAEKKPAIIPTFRRFKAGREQCLEAIARTQTFEEAARELDMSMATLRTRVHLSNIDPDTRRPRVPRIYTAEEEREILRNTIRRALELEIWHIDANGDIQQFRKGDPWRGNEPNLLDEPRRR